MEMFVIYKLREIICILGCST